MATETLQQLFSLIGIPGAVPSGFAAAGSDAGNLLPFDVAFIEQLEHRLGSDPEFLLAAAPAALGAGPTIEAAQELLAQARFAMENPVAALAAAKLACPPDSPCRLPDNAFPGYDHDEIPIDPRMRKFEARADGAAWVLTAVWAWGYRLTHAKPELPSHRTSETEFRYALPRDGKGKTRLALFSDWGTGYYHSRYIAKHIAQLGANCAIHLGDVYYTGRREEFESNFTPILEKYILDKMPMYAMNANHEMDTHGLAYFDFLKKKRKEVAAEQPQEGSYFCLESERVQVVGIDTAYHKNGRYRAGDLVAWLGERLRAGKVAKKVNILLSQNEPYEKKPTALLSDLRAFVDEKLIDFWFWGDQHYGALYPPGPSTQFRGACIGHGGYPYYRTKEAFFAGHYVKPTWSEQETRLPPEVVSHNPSVGNNGFCLLDIDEASGRVDVKFIDWRRRLRHTQHLEITPDGSLHDSAPLPAIASIAARPAAPLAASQARVPARPS